ncbi:MAG: hypothetical protein ACJA1A_002201 [Saprospiraceae bacterium]|jgi:hypothetical protein
MQDLNYKTLKNNIKTVLDLVSDELDTVIVNRG